MAASSFPPQCSALCHSFSSVSVSWFYYLLTISYDAFLNSLISSFSQEMHAELIEIHCQRHSSVAHSSTAFDPLLHMLHFALPAKQEGVSLGFLRARIWLLFCHSAT